MVVSSLFTNITDELNMVEEQLRQYTNSSLDIVNEATLQLIDAGGKRLRPAFTLLTAKMYTDDITDVIPLAVALEILHMASLVHDDVIDNAMIRRGKTTVKKAWGNRISVFAGNHMIARSLTIVAGYERSDIVREIAEASMKICQGEIIQMDGCFNVNLGMKNYLLRIQRKTALLISLSCVLGAMLRNLADERVLIHKRFGHYLGMAYQVIDDVLDFVSDEETLGKPSGGDIRQGVITLPAIYALKHSVQKERLADLLSSPEMCNIYSDDIVQMVIDSGGIDYAYDVAQAFYERSMRQLGMMPESEVQYTFKNIADFIIEREY